MSKYGVFCLLVAGAGAGACARKPEGLSAPQAKAAGDSISVSIEGAARMFGPMDAGASADTSCVTLSGDTTDPDGDHIPNNATLSYACTSTALGLTGMLTGTLGVTDDNPAAVAWAFTGSANLHASLAAGASSLTIDRDGTIVGSQASPFGPYSLDHDVDQTTVIVQAREGGGGPTTTTITEAASWTLTFTPVATWTPGGLIVTGKLAATGDWVTTVDTAEVEATLATPVPLTLDPVCPTLVTAGVVTATYPVENGGSATVTVTWTGCGLHAVTQQRS